MKKEYNLKASVALMEVTGADKRLSDLCIAAYSLIGFANGFMEEAKELAQEYGIHRQAAKPLHDKATRAMEDYLSFIGRGIVKNSTISDFERLSKAFFAEFKEIPETWEPTPITRKRLTEIEDELKVKFAQLPCNIIEEEADGD